MLNDKTDIFREKEDNFNIDKKFPNNLETKYLFKRESIDMACAFMAISITQCCDLRRPFRSSVGAETEP